MAELNLSDDEDDSGYQVCGCQDQYQSARAELCEEHESQIALVMICFWGISLIRVSS